MWNLEYQDGLQWGLIHQHRHFLSAWRQMTQLLKASPDDRPILRISKVFS